jgi:hypothetical protein
MTRLSLTRKGMSHLCQISRSTDYIISFHRQLKMVKQSLMGYYQLVFNESNSNAGKKTMVVKN